MKVQTTKWIGLAAVAASLAACGGGPDIDQVKADFTSPSGSTGDKNGVVAANGARSASSGPSSLGAGGVPGQGLTAQGKGGFEAISIQRMWQGRATQLRDMIFAPGSVRAAQTAEQPSAFDDDPLHGCGETPEAKAAYQELVKDLVSDLLNPLGGSSVSGSAEYTQDFSSCTGGKVTGSAVIALEFEADSSGPEQGHFRFSIGYDMTKVCSTQADQTCLTGEIIAELEATGNMGMGNLQGTTAWLFDATWQQDGAARAAKLKGGIRTTIEGNGTAGSVKIEVLVYVTPRDGEEQSYVWQFEATGDGMGNGMVRWLVRGRDGMIECSVNNEGGMCTATGSNGEATITWTRAEAVTVGNDYFVEE